MRLLTILCLVLLVSCSQEPPLLLVRDGVTYDQNTNELFTGIGEEFYDYGPLRIRTNYIDGEPDGLREWFDRNGNLISTQTFRNGVLIETNENP